MEKENVKQTVPFIAELLDKMEDPRLAKNVTYPLAEILFLLLSANLCGFESLDLVRTFGQEKLSWLKKYFPFSHGIPSADTLGRVLGLVNKKAFEQLFIHWVAGYFKISKEELINFDGKRLNSSADRADQSKKRTEGGRYAEIIVNVYASGAGIVLAQTNVTQKMDEVQGALDLLDWLEVTGCCISGDSNFCARNIIDKIIERKADYLLALKGKSPHLYAAVQDAFAVAPPETIATHVTEEQGHGRHEKRVYRSLPTDQIATQWTESYRNIQQVIEVTRQRTINRTGHKSLEVHYYITSLSHPIEQLADKIRAHWLIENQLHWVLDVEFGEDLCRKRQANLASNSSLVRKIALNLLRRNHGMESLQNKRMKCAISDEYRSNIFT